MRRKPTGQRRTRQVQLRAPESLRRQLEAAARKNNVSVNREMLNRLGHSFEVQLIRSFESVAGDIAGHWARWGSMLHRLNVQGDLVRAVEKLLALLDQPGADDAAKAAAIAEVRKAIFVSEDAAKRMIREAHTS